MKTTPLRVPVNDHAEAGLLARMRGTEVAEVCREALRRGLDQMLAEQAERTARLAALTGAEAR